LLNKRIRGALTKLDPFGEERIITIKFSALYPKNELWQQNQPTEEMFDDRNEFQKFIGFDLKVI